ncbi:MAG: hypothetical protein IJE05_05805 [Clostridia bacterium]|nr:hypothetical protein [Clostridia bacterium]
MENASNALVMAGGVLIGILIISLAVYLFVDFGTTSAQIHQQTEERQITEFNSKFTSYENKEGLTIYDVVTVAEYAYENNKYYENAEEYKITVILSGGAIQDDIQERKNELIIADQQQITKYSKSLRTYECTINSYHPNGRIKQISFK